MARYTLHCGHPISCIVWCTETTTHCGWCAAEVRAEEAEKRVAELERQLAEATMAVGYHDVEEFYPADDA